MKFITSICLLLPLFCFSQAKTAEELRSKDLKKYAIERVEITYEIGGDATGKESLVFTDFGWNALKKRSMTFELYGITKTQIVNEITDGDFVYRLNPEDSTYRTRRDLKWSQQASYQTPDQVSESILFSMGGQQKADATLLGKTCQVWTFENKNLQELWVWQGIPMKRKAKIADRMIETTALEIKLNVSPDPALFTIPEFYNEQD